MSAKFYKTPKVWGPDVIPGIRLFCREPEPWIPDESTKDQLGIGDHSPLISPGFCTYCGKRLSLLRSVFKDVGIVI
jgi:hypothetical protein